MATEGYLKGSRHKYGEEHGNIFKAIQVRNILFKIILFSNIEEKKVNIFNSKKIPHLDRAIELPSNISDRIIFN